MSDAHPRANAIETLVANHRRFLAFLERRTGDRALAEDILQDAFVRSVEKAEQIRDDESVVAWFFRVLRNALVDRARRQAADSRALAKLAQHAERHDDPELDREACACVGELVPLLKDSYAEWIRRVDLGGEGIGDVAAAHGTTPATARVQLHRARAALRREVERTCRTCAEHGCLDCTCHAPKGG